MVRRLIWSQKAQKNRQDIFDYWNDRNKSKVYSKKLNFIFKEQIALIVKYPHMGYETDYENIRFRTVRDYQIVYMVSDKEILLLPIWDSRQNPKKLIRNIKNP